MSELLSEQCRVEAWKPHVSGISEVFHARIVDYGYPAHHHDTWTVLIVDDGAISYTLDKHERGAFGPMVTVLPPGVTHDGKPARHALGFTKRVLYLDESVLPTELVGAAVDQTSFSDTGLRSLIASLHKQLAREGDLHAESLLALIAERIIGHLTRDPGPVKSCATRVAKELRLLLDEYPTGDITLAEAASRLGRSKTHLIRTFTAAYGIPPHAYVLARQIDTARRLLLDGFPAAQVAVDAGFYDQAHLTRHFKRHTSVPPGTYQNSHFRQ